MRPLMRRATAQDIPPMTDLLLREAEGRQTLGPTLWALAADARGKIERAITASLTPNPRAPPELWMLAEAAGQIVGLSHAMIVPPPPIYAAPGRPGLILDDSFTLADAPEGTAQGLLAATEAALKDMGAIGLIASCLEDGPWRPLFTAAGYEPVTLYMSKHGFAAGAATTATRPAGVDDIPAIVALSARHRATLQQLNARFWTIHPEADRRFEGWMRYSLGLTDRDMIVAGRPGQISGYVIAQPITSLHLPAGHEIAHVGIIDDFYATDFAQVARLANGGRNAAGLLASAEAAFARRGVQAALVVCPAAWTSKKALLERIGYRTAKLWMLKA
jgi:hypothetical protein